MKLEISWGAFGAVLVAGTVIYYVGVCVVYFRKEVLQKGRGKKQDPQTLARLFQGEVTQETLTEQQQAPDLTSMSHELVAELKELLTQGASAKIAKDQLTTAIKILLSRYIPVLESPLKESVLHLIRMEAEDRCGIHFSADELVNLP